MLETLDDVDWAALEHAYGEATDVPELIRALAEGDTDDALDELYGNIWHQGTVYEATAHAVPFLVEVLDAPAADRAAVLILLSHLATGSSYLDVHGDLTGRVDRDRLADELAWVRAAREAVLAGAPAYLRLLADDDADVRSTAAFVLATCGVSDALPALRERLTRDGSGTVRAGLVLALHALGDGSGAAAARLTDPDPLVRVAAAVTVILGRRGAGTAKGAADVAGRPEADEAAALDVLERDVPSTVDDVPALPWADGADAAAWTTGALGDRWADRIRLVDAWTRHPDAEVRRIAAYAIVRPPEAHRPAVDALVPVLQRLLADEDERTRGWAAQLLADLGAPAAPAADVLWDLVSRERPTEGAAAAQALRALCHLRDPRADAKVAELLSGSTVDWGVVGSVLPFLGPWAPRCLAPLTSLIGTAPTGNARIGVIDAVGRYGADAAHAVQAIREQLPVQPHIVTQVLGDLGPLAVDALPDLRDALRYDNDYVRLNAARAVYRVGDIVDEPLAVLRADIVEDRARSRALEVLAEFGRHGAPLSDLLPPLFDSSDEWVSSRAAIAYWRVSGDAATAVPALLPHVVALPRGVAVVRCLAEIGPPAAAALPALRAGAGDDPLWNDAIARITSR
ncbi:hypothetical protein Val02_45100 [Virgisporangium aliadipatigenens]|uniref:HEAT repeat domain-containing protein n=1 Tax=Virgisporangium aliadipatigenens TaxID=741659 RepID=A0A8J3YLD9_9ACTN|nr:HEAT repeat domain-containing protein [Virgisporangium aliadipatigenens]GIJ47624.1 hypothetical protein Val02_45100 [Virgisporangium aliadipatigenens]